MQCGLNIERDVNPKKGAENVFISAPSMLCIKKVIERVLCRSLPARTVLFWNRMRPGLQQKTPRPTALSLRLRSGRRHAGDRWRRHIAPAFETGRGCIPRPAGAPTRLPLILGDIDGDGVVLDQVKPFRHGTEREPIVRHGGEDVLDILGLGPFQVQEFPEVVVYRLWGARSVWRAIT